MKKILFLIILLGCTIFADCKPKAEIGVKKLAAEFKNAGFDKVDYTFLGIMPQIPSLYVYKFNMEAKEARTQYTVLVDVKEGIMTGSLSGNYDDIELIEKDMKEIICSEY